MIEIIGAHVALCVSDVERSISFYTSLFGLRVQSQGGDPNHQHLAVLERDAFRLALIQSKTQRPRDDRGGPEHIGFLVRSIQEVGAAADELRRRGIPIDRDATNPRNRRERSIYFRDPDGHLVEIYCQDIRR